MSTKEISVSMTLKLDEQWTQHQTEDELLEYLKARINSSLGFRGQIKRFRVSAKRSAARQQ